MSTSSIIDHIATNCTKYFIKSGVHKVTMSDHFMVYCVRKFNGAVVKSQNILKTREMKNVKEGEILSDVGGIGWEQMLTKTGDIDVLVNH